MRYEDVVRGHPRSVFTYRRGRKPAKAGFDFEADVGEVYRQKKKLSLHCTALCSGNISNLAAPVEGTSVRY